MELPLLLTEIRNVHCEGTMQDNTAREEWIEPMIETLDVEDTNAAPLVGRDGGRNPDSLRS